MYLKIKIMKQTAVEFLQEYLSIHFSFEQKMQFEGLFQQAKEMEKEQIKNAYSSIIGFENLLKKDAEEYYNSTYTQSSE